VTRTRTGRLAAAATVVVTVLALGACGTGGTMHGHGTATGRSGATSSGMMTADEADYLATMIAHHEEAVTAAESLSRSDRPEMRRLGRSIRRGQSRQIVLMARWVDRWYPDATPPRDYVPMMDDLTSLSGDDLDRTFLTEMVHHHMMAVMMSRRLLMGGRVRHPRVAVLARSIVVEQTAEMRQMREWLGAWHLS